MPNFTPDVNCKYGAPMGRSATWSNDTGYTGKMYLQRIPLNNGGYDRGGAYWGIGMPLYAYTSASDTCEEITGYIRAYDRNDAKVIVRGKYPNATFFN